MYLLRQSQMCLSLTIGTNIVTGSNVGLLIVNITVAKSDTNRGHFGD